MLDELFSEDNIYLGVEGNNFLEVLNNVSKEYKAGVLPDAGSFTIIYPSFINFLMIFPAVAGGILVLEINLLFLKTG